MYRAALEGDWLGAEILVSENPNLASDKITERGDRALHVAVSLNHKNFVQKLVERLSPSDLVQLLDGHGYTACCYAALSGTVDIADLLIKKNPKVGTARDQDNVTPLQKAAWRGNAKMVSYFLEFAKVEDLSEEELFDLLVVCVRRKMYDVSLKILRMKGSIATMTNKEGTALHLVARQEILIVRTRWRHKNLDGVMEPEVRVLAEELLAEIKKLGEDRAVELMKTPSILHEAAKARNVELITMLTRTYPELIWHINGDGYSIFHIAVIYKNENVFHLINQIGAMKDLIAPSQDGNGDNILHLAGKLTPQDRRKMVPLIALQMQREITWFKKVEAIVPPSCLEMKNKEALKPGEVFSKEHEMLLKQSETWMRNTADSCMLISTIILTVVFAAAFTVPGGYNSQTGTPVLSSKTFWFTCFAISEAAALFGSIQAIVQFWAIMTSSFEQDLFLFVLPKQLTIGLSSMLWSLVGTFRLSCVCTFWSSFRKARGQRGL